MATLDDTAAPVAEKSVESSASAVEWASIFGGALAAFWALATLLIAVLVTLGSAATAGAAAAAATSIPAVPPTPEAAEQARKIAAAFAFTTSLSLLIGAFVASAAGALGGFHRDEA